MIVHVASAYPPTLGGIQKVVEALAGSQVQRGQDVIVLTSDQGYAGSNYIDPEPNLAVKRLPSSNIANTPIILGLPKYLIKNVSRDDLVHLHVSGAFAPEAVWLSSRIKGFNYIAHIHGEISPTGLAGFLLKLYKPLVLRHVLRKAQGVIVPTPDYRQWVHKNFSIPLEKIQALPNGTSHTLAIRPRSAPAAQETVKLLFVGRLSAQKNLPLMLEAVKLYTEKYKRPIALTLVGDGEAKTRLQKQIDELGLSKIVEISKPLRGLALEKKYAESDIFLLTSHWETFGIVLVEAMTKGLPIVSVNIAGVRNIFTKGRNGMLVESRATEIANAIHQLITKPGLYEQTSRHNLVDAARYQWSRVTVQYDPLYKENLSV